MCIALWVNIKSLRIQVLQKSQIPALPKTTPPRVNRVTSKPINHSSWPGQQCLDQSTQDPNSCVAAIHVVANLICHGRDRWSTMDDSKLHLLHPNLGYRFPFTYCDFLNLLRILRWMFKESGEYDAGYRNCWLFFFLFSIWIIEYVFSWIVFVWKRNFWFNLILFLE